MKNLDNFNMKSKKLWEVEGVKWREVKFNKLISKEKYQVGKVKVRNGLANFGRIPVVDQSQELIRGYLDNEELKYKGPLPLIIFGDHTKVIKFIDFPFIVGADGIKILIPNKNLLYPKYFYWLLRKIKLPNRGYARHFKFLKQATYLIPFRNGKPDLETQKKIVEYIEANFSKIDKILEKKKKELEKLDELWESVLEQAFKPKEGEEWREVRLGDKRIAEIIMGQSPPSSSYNKEGKGTPFLQGNKEFGKFHPKHVMFTSDPKKRAQKGDILLSVRAPVGDVNIADQEYCIGRGLAAIRFNGEPKYLFYLFVLIKEQLEELGKRGTTFKAITKNHLKTLEIPIPFRNNQPDLEKQREIANYLDSVYEKIKTLKQKIQNQITQLEEMKESILDKVFNHDESYCS